MSYEDMNVDTAETIASPQEFEVNVVAPKNGGLGIMDFLYDTFYDDKDVISNFRKECIKRNKKSFRKID